MRSKLGMMFGLSVKAGKSVIGLSLALDAVRGGKSKNIYIPSDISAGSEKKAVNCAAYYKAEIKKIPLTGEEIAEYCGKKSKVSCIAITDINFVSSINSLLSI